MRWLAMALAVVIGGVVSAASARTVVSSADESVTIDGGPDTTLQNYSWTVTNHHTSPIVYVKIPHYRAAVFEAPRRWDTSKTTYLVNVGVPDKAGFCVAEAIAPTPGISRGSSREFKMSLNVQRGLLGKGTVIVRFADGTEAKVFGVELSVPPEPSGKWVPLIGAGAIFVVWVLIRTLRQRGKPARAADESAGDADDRA